MKNRFIIFIFAVVAIFGIAVSLPVLRTVPSPAPAASSTVVTAAPSSTAPTAIPSNSTRLQFPSLDAQYVFNLYAIDGGTCPWRVSDSEGNEVNLDKVASSYQIWCLVGEEFKSNFRGWADGDKLLLRGNPGEIQIIEVKNATMEIHHYDASSYYFDAADRSLRYWLYQHNEGGGPYTILDANGKIVLANLTGYQWASYDPVNDGFVFSIVAPVASSTETLRIDYLPISTFKLRNILTTNPFMPAQRGATSPSLTSKSGEIFYSPGFGGVDLKYFDSNGNIPIKL